MMLSLENITVQYGKQIALQLKDPLVIEEGDRIGVIGSNGAGKTTLVKTILGLTQFTGSVRTSLKPEDMAVHMQFNNYVNTMSVRSILEAILNTRIRKNQKLRELITFFEFEGCLGKRFSSLSGGQKQRLTIIMVMLQDAPLTFFDEVTSGLDFESRQRLMEKLTAWYHGRKNTLIVVSHYYEELEQMCNKILFLDQGKVMAFGDSRTLFVKYCGNAAVTLDNTPENKKLLDGFSLLEAPAHLLAVSCTGPNEEERLFARLCEHNVNFRRSNNNLELLSINARTHYLSQKGEIRDDQKM